MKRAASSPRRLASLAALVAATLLAGCAVPFANYALSSANVASMRSLQRGVELGDFTGKQSDVSCRLRRIGPDGDRTFSQYIRAAFNDELVIAGPPAGRERSALSMKVIEVSVDCGHIWSSWTIEAEVQVANQSPFTVKVSRPFEGSFLADVVQQRAGQAFAPTVQQFIATVIDHPVYKDEFAGRPARR